MAQFQFGLHIGGDKELKKVFAGLGFAVQKKVVREASRKAMKPITTAIKANAPRESGLLQKSIGVKQKTYKLSGVVMTVTGPRAKFKRKVTVKVKRGKKTIRRNMMRNPAIYAHLVEGGTKPHTLGKYDRLARPSRIYKRARGGKTKSEAITSRQSGAALHPGTAPRPFMSRAYEMQKAKALRIYRDELWIGINKIAEREARKTASVGRVA